MIVAHGHAFRVQHASLLRQCPEKYGRAPHTWSPALAPPAPATSAHGYPSVCKPVFVCELVWLLHAGQKPEGLGGEQHCHLHF